MQQDLPAAVIAAAALAARSRAPAWTPLAPADLRAAAAHLDDPSVKPLAGGSWGGVLAAFRDRIAAAKAVAPAESRADLAVHDGFDRAALDKWAASLGPFARTLAAAMGITTAGGVVGPISLPVTVSLPLSVSVSLPFMVSLPVAVPVHLPVALSLKIAVTRRPTSVGQRRISLRVPLALPLQIPFGIPLHISLSPRRVQQPKKLEIAVPHTAQIPPRLAPGFPFPFPLPLTVQIPLHVPLAKPEIWPAPPSR
nr:hypothetical protein HK105_000163 [Polyrhizophydium stewartii]